MAYENYVYEIPKELKDSMNRKEALPEFADEAAKIITEYVRKYKPEDIPNTLTECRIRDLLSYERLRKQKLKPEARDYWIKVYMLLIDRDFEYEKELMDFPSEANH